MSYMLVAHEHCIGEENESSSWIPAYLSTLPKKEYLLHKKISQDATSKDIINCVFANEYIEENLPNKKLFVYIGNGPKNMVYFKPNTVLSQYNLTKFVFTMSRYESKISVLPSRDMKVKDILDVKPYVLPKNMHQKKYLLHKFLIEIPSRHFNGITVRELQVTPDCDLNGGSFSGMGGTVCFKGFVALERSIRRCFYESNVSKVVLCEGIERIENQVFSPCLSSSLTSIVGEYSAMLPASLKYLGNGAFRSSYIKSYDFSQTNVVTMPTRCFENSLVEEIIFPRSLLAIGAYAFAQCRNLRIVDFSNSSELRTIVEGAFCGCINLAEVTLPPSLKIVCAYAFSNCISLTKIDMGKTLVHIMGKACFKGCLLLTQIVLPPELTYIDEEVFARCSNVNVIHIPKKVKAFFSQAFSHTKNLKKITVSGGFLPRTCKDSFYKSKAFVQANVITKTSSQYEPFDYSQIKKNKRL